jgi:hypothetical protein
LQHATLLRRLGTELQTDADAGAWRLIPDTAIQVLTITEEGQQEVREIAPVERTDLLPETLGLLNANPGQSHSQKTSMHRADFSHQ